ncbi:unnamed protein product [Chrysoparadoxa australica]
MSGYSTATLIGNAIEERAAPLRGVLVDAGHRCFETTSLSQFTPVRLCAESKKSDANLLLTKGGAAAMVQQETLPEATLIRPVLDDGFNNILEGSSRLGESAEQPLAADTPTCYQSTSRADFGEPDRESITAQRARHRPDAPPAAAPSAGREIKQARNSFRPIAGPFADGVDPLKSTAVQRSWMSTDPLAQLAVTGPPPEVEVEYPGLGIGEGSNNTGGDGHFGRRRSITAQCDPMATVGETVWMD